MSSSKEVMKRFYENHPNYKKEYRKTHPEVVEKEKAYTRNYQKERRNRIRDMANEAKNKPCNRCRKQYNPWVMDLDHQDQSTKIMNVSAMVRWGYSIEAITTEIAKCEVLCANCHREKSHKQQLQNGKESRKT